MVEPRQPQDHRQKATKPEPEEFFSFTAGGEQFTMPRKTLDVVTPGYNRRMRKLDDEDRLWTILEDLADGDEAILAAFDGMTGPEGRREWEQLQRDLAAHLGASPGE